MGSDWQTRLLTKSAVGCITQPVQFSSWFCLHVFASLGNMRRVGKERSEILLILNSLSNACQQHGEGKCSASEHASGAGCYFIDHRACDTFDYELEVAMPLAGQGVLFSKMTKAAKHACQSQTFSSAGCRLVECSGFGLKLLFQA